MVLLPILIIIYVQELAFLPLVQYLLLIRSIIISRTVSTVYDIICRLNSEFIKLYNNLKFTTTQKNSILPCKDTEVMK